MISLHTTRRRSGRFFPAGTAGLAAVLMACLLLAGCGYTWRGERGSLSENSVLGAGNKTLRIKDIDQTTLYPWLPYMIRSQVRDDINARGLAIWKDNGATDYTLTVRVPSFQIRSYGEYKDRTLLFTATIQMEFIVFDGRTNTEVWRSGLISYSEQYENANEEQAIKETISLAIRRCMDSLQQRF